MPNQSRGHPMTPDRERLMREYVQDGLRSTEVRALARDDGLTPDALDALATDEARRVVAGMTEAAVRQTLAARQRVAGLRAEWPEGVLPERDLFVAATEASAARPLPARQALLDHLLADPRTATQFAAWAAAQPPALRALSVSDPQRGGDIASEWAARLRAHVAARILEGAEDHGVRLVREVVQHVQTLCAPLALPTRALAPLIWEVITAFYWSCVGAPAPSTPEPGTTPEPGATPTGPTREVRLVPPRVRGRARAETIRVRRGADGRVDRDDALRMLGAMDPKHHRGLRREQTAKSATGEEIVARDVAWLWRHYVEGVSLDQLARERVASPARGRDFEGARSYVTRRIRLARGWLAQGHGRPPMGEREPR